MSIAQKFRAWDFEKNRFLSVEEFECIGVFNGYSDPVKNGYGIDVEFSDGNIELQSFTGSKDTKDIEIFDGDILQGEDGEQCRVEWDDELIGWGVVFLDDGMCDRLYDYLDWQVIGNIYENPSLLEESK